MTETKEYRSSRGKTLLYLLLCLGFVAAAALPASRTPNASPLWSAIIFFGSGAAVFAFLLIRPQRLVLDCEGFTLTGGFVLKPFIAKWCDIEGFFVHSLPRGGKIIGFNYRPEARPDSMISRLSHRLGVDAGLPKGWPGSPEDMAEELNAFRARALGYD